MFSSPIGPSHFAPPAATGMAVQYDHLYGFLLIISFIASVLVIGGLIAFAIKYRRESDEYGAYISHNTTLEFLWSFIPFVIFMVAFVWGWQVFHEFRKMPTHHPLEIQVEAQQWNWTFVYKNGRTSVGEIYVPLGQSVKLVMTSKDVIHSFFVPAFREKQDVVPGTYTDFWFKPTLLGNFDVFCSQFCGDGHSLMLAKIHVVPREKYDEWMANDPFKGMSLSDIGKKVYSTTCIACHDVTSQRKIGPGWGGIWGTTVQLEGGKSALVDENYIREKLVNPDAQVPVGYPKGVMPTFAGQLNDQQIMGIIAYIKTLKK